MSRELTADSAAAIREDFLEWCSHFGVQLYDWQTEAFGEALRREDGRFVYRVAAVSVPRGNGKSFAGAAVGAWFMTRKPRAHVLSSALGLESAAVVLNYGREFFREQSGVELMANAIRIPSTGSRWTITSREHTTSRGQHPDLVSYDEVGWASDDELFASLLSSQASVDDPLMLIISTVGRRKTGPLWIVKTLAEGGDPSVFWWYSQENRSPRISADFLSRQRRILMPTQYAREHENAWVEAADSFTIAADVDAAMGHGWTEQADGKRGVAYNYFVDLGAVHDPTVICVGHAEDGIIYIDKLVTFQGSREHPVQIPVVEQAIKDLAELFPPEKIRIESWQGLASVQSLGGLGLPVSVFTPTAKSNANEWPVLAQRLTTRTLVLPAHGRLREELLNLTYEVGPQGVRVIDKGKIHQDHAVAVRGVVAALIPPSVPDLELWQAGDRIFGEDVDVMQKLHDEDRRERAELGAQGIASACQAQGFWFP